MTKAQRNAKAAIKDPHFGIMPQYELFHMNQKDRVPVEAKPKAFLSPVFLVDPMFTADKKDEEIVVFRDNDFAGWKQPISQSKFPIIRKEVQKFFMVGEDCTQGKLSGKKIAFTEPSYSQMHLQQHYRAVFEPQYVTGAKKPKAMNGKACFYGNDYGGHNIPFPIPAPPKPDPYYEDIFYDMTPHIGQLYFENPYALKEAYWAKKGHYVTKSHAVATPTLKATSHAVHGHTSHTAGVHGLGHSTGLKVDVHKAKTPAAVCPLMAAKATLAAHNAKISTHGAHSAHGVHAAHTTHSAHKSHAAHGAHAVHGAHSVHGAHASHGVISVAPKAKAVVTGKDKLSALGIIKDSPKTETLHASHGITHTQHLAHAAPVSKVAHAVRTVSQPHLGYGSHGIGHDLHTAHVAPVTEKAVKFENSWDVDFHKPSVQKLDVTPYGTKKDDFKTVDSVLDSYT